MWIITFVYEIFHLFQEKMVYIDVNISLNKFIICIIKEKE